MGTWGLLECPLRTQVHTHARTHTHACMHSRTRTHTTGPSLFTGNMQAHKEGPGLPLYLKLGQDDAQRLREVSQTGATQLDMTPGRQEKLSSSGQQILSP